MYWGAGRESRYSRARRGVHDLRGHGALRGVEGLLEASGGVRGVLGASRE